MGSIRIAASFLVGLLLLVGLFAVVQHYAMQFSGVVFDPEDGFAAQFAKYKQHRAPPRSSKDSIQPGVQNDCWIKNSKTCSRTNQPG